MLSLLRSAIIVIVAVVLSHLFYAFALTAHSSATFKERGPNIRDIEFEPPEEDGSLFGFPARSITREAGETLLGAYAQRVFGQKKDTNILFVGSSLTYGYALRQDASLGAVMGQLLDGEAAIANYSIIGGSMNQLTLFMCRLGELETKPDLLIVEIPIFNDLAQGRSDVVRDCRTEDPSPYISEFEFFLKNPWGVQAVPRMLPHFPDRDGSTVIPNTRIPSTYKMTAEDVRRMNVIYADRTQAMINAAKQVSDNVIVFGAPLYRPAFEEANLVDSLELFDDIWSEICDESGVICHLPSSGLQSSRENFYNISHLNREGAQDLSIELVTLARDVGIELPASVPFKTIRKFNFAGNQFFRLHNRDLAGLVAQSFGADPDKDEAFDAVLIFREREDDMELLVSSSDALQTIRYSANLSGITLTSTWRYGDGRRLQTMTGTVESTKGGWIERYEDGSTVTTTIDQYGAITRRLGDQELQFEEAGIVTVIPLSTGD